MPPDVDVNYCYVCGRNVGKQAGKCWYCAAPTRREIRAPRRCPYCDEPIRSKAIKCFNCGEYLDGRPRDAPERPVQAGPTFVIEKAVIQGDPRAGIGGGAIVPADHQIGGPQVARIEGPAPVQARGALPAPENDAGEVSVSIQSISAASVSGGPSAAPGAGGRSRDLIPAPPRGNAQGASAADQNKELAIVAEPSARNLPARVAAEAGTAIAGAAAGALKRAWAARKKKGPGTIDVSLDDEEAKFRICGVCGTEILAADNYCFHCGQRYKAGKDHVPVHGLPNGGIYGLMGAAFVLHVGSGLEFGQKLISEQIGASYQRPIEIGSGIAVPVLAFWAFLRSRGWKGRSISLLVFAASLAAVYLI